MGDYTMANIEVKLAAWKNKLLDLGKLNKLINNKEISCHCLIKYKILEVNKWQQI